METHEFIHSDLTDVPRKVGPQSLALVVAESQTGWRDWVRRNRTAPYVLAQKNNETASRFSMRVHAELERLRTAGVLIRHAAFFPGSAGNEDIVTARFSVGVTLATHLATGGGGVLLLRSTASHRSLHNLAATIRYTVEGSGVFVICTEGSAELNLP